MILGIGAAVLLGGGVLIGIAKTGQTVRRWREDLNRDKSAWE
jgi:hypothetical protein